MLSILTPFSLLDLATLVIFVVKNKLCCFLLCSSVVCWSTIIHLYRQRYTKFATVTNKCKWSIVYN